MHSYFFFFNDTATTEIYTLSLHDALPICDWAGISSGTKSLLGACQTGKERRENSDHCEPKLHDSRSEEHTSELQSQSNLVCRLLLEKKKKKLSAQSISSFG